MPPDFDLAIVGAGVVGCSLARLFAETPLRISLIEAHTAAPPPAVVAEPGTPSDFSARTAALSPASRTLLERVGAWQLLPPARICPYAQMRVWDADGSGGVCFDAAELSATDTALGWIVEQDAIEHSLSQLVASQDGLQLLRGTGLSALQLPLVEGEPAHLSLADGSRLSAALVIGADGARSAVRKLAGIDHRVWDCRQTAIAVVAQTERVHQDTAWQRFTEHGPLAFLPLAGGGGHFCSVVWSADSDVATALLALEDSAFCRALARSFEHRLGVVRAVGSRVSFALSQRHAEDYARPGCVLVGDAVRAVHPLAGQGLNLGLTDVAVLGEELLRWRRSGGAMGALQPLLRYQRRCREHNLAMLGSMAGLQQLFAARHPLLRLARNEGLRWVDRSPALKRFFAHRAMGA